MRAVCMFLFFPLFLAIFSFMSRIGAYTGAYALSEEGEMKSQRVSPEQDIASRSCEPLQPTNNKKLLIVLP